MFLAAATLIPIGALSWLGMRTLQQDRELERQRRRERLEVTAGRVALEIGRRLQGIDEQLARGSGVHFLPTGIESSPDIPVLFQPIETSPPEAPPPSLAAAEAEEFQRRNLPAAETAYRHLAEAGPPALRAAALVGLGRVLRLGKHYDGALRAYADLERLGTVIVAGQPAGLVARQGRCKVLEAAGDVERLRAEVRDLARSLESGDWSIDRATFDLYRDMVEQWGGAARPPVAIARTEAAVDLWHVWRRGDLGSRGRRLMSRETGPVLALWAGDDDRLTAWFATGPETEASWRSIWDAQGLSVALSDVEGHPFAGAAGALGVSLAPSETRLPFILTASAPTTDDRDGTRRSVLILGLLSAFVLMLAAAYGLYRTTTRELALARQQAEFVSAVSHEFRTPLTSMRHLTELLVSRRPTSEERKAHYYELLAHETERLHRMVESLLSFGRMDVDAYTWQLEPADVTQIVRGIVDEFRRESAMEGRQVTCEIEDGLPPIRADHEALSRALWNLLENAGKYSESGSPIHVFARRQGDSVLLGVRDEGLGIPSREQKRIFQKFVRGADATRAGVRGVGIGLALVTRIVQAHGGSVRLDSEPGRGSTFTIVLPAES